MTLKQGDLCVWEENLVLMTDEGRAIVITGETRNGGYLVYHRPKGQITKSAVNINDPVMKEVMKKLFDYVK